MGQRCGMGTWFRGLAGLLALVAGLVVGCRSAPGDASSGLPPAATVETTAVPTSLPPLEPPDQPPPLPPPHLDILASDGEPAGLDRPLYTELEIVGRELTAVTVAAGRYETDGRRRLLLRASLQPGGSNASDLAHGSASPIWPDGVVQTYLIWDTAVAYVHDGTGSRAPAPLWPTPDGFTLSGWWLPPAGGEPVAAELVVAAVPGPVVGVRQSAGGAPLEPSPGDQFQLDAYFLAADDALSAAPAETLTFGEQGVLAVDWEALPSGSYFVQFLAESAAGETAVARRDVTVDNDRSTGHVYLDPIDGFQFTYPDGWTAPSTAALCPAGSICARDASGGSRLTITRLPNLSRAEDATALQQTALSAFGPVERLYAQPVSLDGTPGQMVAYGYTAGDGPHTGLLVSLVRDGVGFLVDLDGPAAQEAANVAAITHLIDGWQFRPVRFGAAPGRWLQLDTPELALAYPADHYYQLFNGWHRFSGNDGHSFLALRPERRGRQQPAAVLARYQSEAAAGVVGFTASRPYPVTLGGLAWQRADFRYQASDGVQVRGFVMVTAVDDTMWIGWGEGPADSFMTMERDQLLVMLAGIDRAIQR